MNALCRYQKHAPCKGHGSLPLSICDVRCKGPRWTRSKPTTPPPAAATIPAAHPAPLRATSGAQAVVLRFVCHDMDDVRRLMAAGVGLSCHVGLESLQ